MISDGYLCLGLPADPSKVKASPFTPNIHCYFCERHCHHRLTHSILSSFLTHPCPPHLWSCKSVRSDSHILHPSPSVFTVPRLTRPPCPLIYIVLPPQQSSCSSFLLLPAHLILYYPINLPGSWWCHCSMPSETSHLHNRPYWRSERPCCPGLSAQDCFTLGIFLFLLALVSRVLMQLALAHLLFHLP